MSQQEVPRGFEPRSLDSESRVLTVTPRDQMLYLSRTRLSANLRNLVYKVNGSGWLARRAHRSYLGERRGIPRELKASLRPVESVKPARAPNDAPREARAPDLEVNSLTL